MCIHGDNSPTATAELWQLRAGQCPWLLIDYVNGTSWPYEEALQAAFDKPMPDRVKATVQSSGHVQFFGETHCGKDRHAGLSAVVEKSKKWLIHHGPARPSDTSENGTYGGVLGLVRKCLAVEQLAQSSCEKGVWSCGSSPWFTGCFIRCCSNWLLTLGIYCKDGICSQWGDELTLELAKLTCNGRQCFIAIGDWNSTPEQVKESHILDTLDAEVICSGVATGRTRDINFAIVSRRIVHLVKGFAVRDDTNFATHASVRLCISRHLDDYARLAPIQPKKLPAIAKDVQQSPAAVALWKTIVAEEVAKAYPELAPKPEIKTTVHPFQEFLEPSVPVVFATHGDGANTTSNDSMRQSDQVDPDANHWLDPESALSNVSFTNASGNQLQAQPQIPQLVTPQSWGNADEWNDPEAASSSDDLMPPLVSNSSSVESNDDEDHVAWANISDDPTGHRPLPMGGVRTRVLPVFGPLNCTARCRLCHRGGCVLINGHPSNHMFACGCGDDGDFWFWSHQSQQAATAFIHGDDIAIPASP
jgi:hypothetical protein